MQREPQDGHRWAGPTLEEVRQGLVGVTDTGGGGTSTGGRGLAGPCETAAHAASGLPSRPAHWRAGAFKFGQHRGAEVTKPGGRRSRRSAPRRLHQLLPSVSNVLFPRLTCPLLSPSRTCTVGTGPPPQSQPHAPSSDSARLPRPEPRSRATTTRPEVDVSQSAAEERGARPSARSWDAGER